MKLKKGDTIIVTTGKDKGKKGKIDEVFPADRTVRVQGINMFKRHTKKRDEKTQGGIIEKPKPIASSKLALVCPKCGKVTRIGFILAKAVPAGRQGEKERVCRKCGARI